MSKPKIFFVLMTALVPTVGHAAISRFADALCNSNRGDLARILVIEMAGEPTRAYYRADAIRDAIWPSNMPVDHHIIHHLKDKPPENDFSFWEGWADHVAEYLETCAPKQMYDWVIVSSELYGKKLATMIDAEWYPFDISRQVLNISGTKVRKDLYKHMDYVLPTFRQHLQLKVCLFGAESTGKTTVGKRLAEKLNALFVPEWAREFLEIMGPEVTPARMEMIGRGQAALMRSAVDSTSSPIIIFDTDLYSTIGYHGIYGTKPTFQVRRDAQLLQSDVYILMNDKIPFTPDPLRYGGDKRESNNDYWRGIMNTHRLKHIEVPDGLNEDQTVAHLLDRIMGLWYAKNEKIIKYKRE